jgi:hypothetical protein
VGWVVWRVSMDTRKLHCLNCRAYVEVRDENMIKKYE